MTSDATTDQGLRAQRDGTLGAIGHQRSGVRDSRHLDEAVRACGGRYHQKAQVPDLGGSNLPGGWIDNLEPPDELRHDTSTAFMTDGG